MAADRKLYLGGRLRRLRRELGVNQSGMAAELGMSPSYLNHLERNQRPVTAGVLLRLAQAYDLDLRTFTGEPDSGGEADLQEVFADPLFRDLPIPRHEVVDLAENAPGAGGTITSGIASSWARAAACTGPAPPKAIRRNSCGS